MKQTGIWLDFDHANIIQLEGEKVTKNIISSNIEDYHLKGGSRSKTPWGPMEKTSESKHLQRRKQQEKAFYKAICKAVENSNELFVMGPAEAKIGLQKYIEGYKNLNDILLDVQTADSITENQKVARVKAFFAEIPSNTNKVFR